MIYFVHAFHGIQNRLVIEQIPFLPFDLRKKPFCFGRIIRKNPTYLLYLAVPPPESPYLPPRSCQVVKQVRPYQSCSSGYQYHACDAFVVIASKIIQIIYPLTIFSQMSFFPNPSRLSVNLRYSNLTIHNVVSISMATGKRFR